MACCCSRKGGASGSASPNINNDHAMEPLNKDGKNEDEINKTDTTDSNPYGFRKRSYDPDFKGPTEKRSCTDIICLLIFLLAITAHIGVAFFAYKHGDPRILLRPTDSGGHVCGYGKYANRTKLIFFDLIKCARTPAELMAKGCPTPQVCVTACPTSNWVWIDLASQERIANKILIDERLKTLICQTDFDIASSKLSIEELVTQEICAPYYLESRDYFGRCVPKMMDDVANFAKNNTVEFVQSDKTKVTYQQIVNRTKVVGEFFASSGWVSNVLTDIASSWIIILIGIGIGGILSFLWCMLIEFFACILVYLTLIMFFFAFVSSSTYCYYRYAFVAPNEVDWGNLVLSKNMQYYLNFKETWLTFAIISTIFTVIVLLILICLGKQIQLAVSLLGEATKAVGSNLTTLIFPIIPWIFQTAALLFWAFVAVYLASSGKPSFYSKINNTVVDNFTECSLVRKSQRTSCRFIMYTGNKWSLYLQLYNVFMGFWYSCFAVSFGELVLAGVFALWYWAFNKSKDMSTFPLLKSIWRALRYHLGSLAFGSLLIATTKFARFLLEMLERNMKGSENAVSKFGICILRCCFWCLEKCLKFLTKNAYIMMAIHGKPFCFAAKDAFFLIMRNILRMAVLTGVTGFVLSVGKLLMAGSAAALGYLFFDHKIPYTEGYVPQLNYLFVPVIIIFIGTWIVAKLFFSVFEFAVDTMFLCAMEDIERNDGSVEKPYFMGSSLMEVLDVKNSSEVEEIRKRQKSGCCCCRCC